MNDSDTIALIRGQLTELRHDVRSLDEKVTASLLYRNEVDEIKTDVKALKTRNNLNLLLLAIIAGQVIGVDKIISLLSKFI